MEASAFNDKIHCDADLALERLRVHRLRPDAVIANERRRRAESEAQCLKLRATWYWATHGAAVALAALWLWRSPWGATPASAGQWIFIGMVGVLAYLTVLALYVPSVAALRLPRLQFEEDAQPISLAQLEQINADIEKIPALRSLLSDWVDSGHPLRVGDLRLISEALPALRGREVLVLLQRHSIGAAQPASSS